MKLNFIDNFFSINKGVFSEGIKYFFVGGICTVVDLTMLYSLTHFEGLDYILSSIISFTIATVINYFLCKIYVFSKSIITNCYLEFFYYIIITIVGIGINTAVIWSFTEFFNLYYMFSKIPAIAATYFWNFGARKYFLHTLKKLND